MTWKRDTILLALFAVVIVSAFALFQISKSRTFQFFGELTAHVQTDEKVVALTFDDAPTEYTDEVLAILKQKKAKATFYVIGNELEKMPELGKQIVEQGHDLGNHSYSHERFLLKSQSFIDAEIQKTNKLIKDTGYKNEITFRPPYGKKLFGLPFYLQQNNIKTIMWDIEPDSYVDKNKSEKEQTEFIVNYTAENTKPGSIILLHPFCKECEADRKAIPQIIDRLQKQGYTFVTITKLLTY